VKTEGLVLEDLEPMSLATASEKYFDAPWRMPIAIAALQQGGLIRIREIMQRLPGLDRSVGLKALDRLVALGAFNELPRAVGARKNEQRQFVVNADHVTWQIFSLIAEAEREAG